MECCWCASLAARRKTPAGGAVPSFKLRGLEAAERLAAEQAAAAAEAAAATAPPPFVPEAAWTAAQKFRAEKAAERQAMAALVKESERVGAGS
jgi:hypothetical protein